MSLSYDTNRSAGESRSVGTVIARTRDQTGEIEDATQEEVDRVVGAIASAICREQRVEQLCQTAVDETGRGVVEDKIHKTQTVLRAAVADLRGEPSVGVVDRDPTTGVVEIAKPVGVIGALVPSTNPVGTPALLAMLAVKGRNGIVISPPPTAAETVERVVAEIQETLATHDFPRGLVQTVPRPITKGKAYALLDLADVAQVTGSAKNVSVGESCGTPNYCVGEGNPTAIVDPSADFDLVADRIEHSVTYDNGLICLSLSNIVVPETNRAGLVDAIEAVGGYVCEPGAVDPVRETLFVDGDLSREMIGKSTREIATSAGLPAAARESSFLVVPVDAVGVTEPLSGELLSPAVSLYTVDDIEAGVELTNRLLAFEGRGHSCVVYSDDRQQAVEIGKEIDVCRLAVNQSTISLATGTGNGARPSLSLGGGAWAGNQIDENLTYEYFLDRTRVFQPTGE